MKFSGGVARLILATWGSLLAVCLGALWLGQSGLAGAAEAPSASAGRLATLTLNTLYTAGLATLLAMVWALPAALVVGLTPSHRLSGAIAGLALAPGFAAPAAVAVAGVRLLGAQGPVAEFWFRLRHALSGTPIPTAGEEVIRAAPAFTLTATALLLAVALFPVAFLALWSALRRVDPDVAEAAMLEGGLPAVLRHVIGPAAGPAAVPGLAALFLLAATEFSIPESLRSQPVLVTEVYNCFQVSYDPRAAFLASLPLIAGVLLAALPLAGRLGAEAPATPAWPSASPIARRMRFLVPVALVTAALPLAIVVWPLASTLDGPAGRLQVLAVTWETVQEELRFSLILAAGGAALCSLAGIALGIALHSLRRPAAGRLLLLFCFVVPAPVLAVGIRMLTNLPPGALPFGLEEPLARLESTVIPLLVAWMLRLAPLTALTVEAALRRLPREWEECARLDGGSLVALLRGYGWQAIRPAVLAGMVLGFALLLGEAGAALILIPPGTTTLSVRLLTLMHFAPTGQVSALALFLVLPVIPAVIFLSIAARGLRKD